MSRAACTKNLAHADAFGKVLHILSKYHHKGTELCQRSSDVSKALTESLKFFFQPIFFQYQDKIAGYNTELNL